MVIGAFTWSYVVGNVVANLSSMSEATTEFRRSMSSLNAYLRANHLPPATRQRLRDYFHRTEHLWQGKAMQRCLLRMSPGLQGEVVIYVNAAWLDKVRGRVPVCPCAREPVSP